MEQKAIDAYDSLVPRDQAIVLMLLIVLKDKQIQNRVKEITKDINPKEESK